MLDSYLNVFQTLLTKLGKGMHQAETIAACDTPCLGIIQIHGSTNYEPQTLHTLINPFELDMVLVH